MPYVKAIHIYTEQGLDNCTDYVEDQEKTSIAENRKNLSSNSYLHNAIGYVANEDKTSLYKNNPLISQILDDDIDILVSGYRCNVATVEKDFERIREDYYKEKKENLSEEKKARVAYHFIQSFDPRFKIDPRLVHQIGLELLERLEHYQGTVNTHMNTEHIHNHIVMNAFSCDELKKWQDNMETIYMLRNISDEISLKYGVPIILNPAKGKSMSYYEWLNVKQGTSWKQQIRNDISTTMQVCSSWEEYVQIMRASGYVVRETGKSITYVLPTNPNKRVRDSKLGPEFTKTALIEYWENNIKNTSRKIDVVNPATQVRLNKQKKVNLYVSRYTSSGRKRTDLEILFLIAIKIIKVVGDKFRSEEAAILQPANPMNRLASWKLTQMIDSLHLLQELNIKNKDELQELLSTTGAELNHIKKEVLELENNIGRSADILEAINEVKELKPFVDSIGFVEKELIIPHVDDKEVRKNRAAISPLTAKQRRELFVALSDSDKYRINCDFDELTHEEGRAVIDFLKSKSLKKPEMVVSLDEYQKYSQGKKIEKIRERKTANLKKKYGNIPVSPFQKETILRIEPKIADSLDIESLSFFDGLMLIAYLKSEEPFEGDLITEEQILILEQLLERNKFIINRQIHTVTEKEYYSILKYFDGKTKVLPDLLKPSEKIPESFVVQLKELLEYRNKSIPFEVEELSMVDSNKLYSYLLNIDVIPECLSKENALLDVEKNYDALFKSKMLDYSEEEYEILSRYRAALITLNNVGIKEDSIEEAQNIILNRKRELENVKAIRDDLSTKYYNYSRLNYNLNLAENSAFTHGTLYEKEMQDIEIIQIEDKDNVDSEILAEEKSIDEKKQDVVFREDDEYFNKNEMYT